MTSAPPPPPPQTTRHPTSGVVALIMGILGLTALPVIGSILALVFGYQSRSEAERHPDVYSDDFGRIGRILGWVGVALMLAVIVLAALAVVFFMAI